MFAIAFTPSLNCIAAENEHPYLSGNIVALQQKLRTPSNPQAEIPLEELLHTLSVAYAVPIWIDRSIERDIRVALQLDKDSTLEDVLQQAASKVDSKIVLLDSVVALLPLENAAWVELNYWQFRQHKLPSQWLQVEENYGWSDGESIQDIATTFSKQVPIQSKWVTELPHDLWPAFRFPNANRWTIGLCIASGNNRMLTYHTKDSSVQIVSIPQRESPPSVRWTYSQPQIAELGAKHCKAWRQRTADATITGGRDGSWTVLASPEAHRDLVKPLIPKPTTKPATNGKSLFTGTLQGRLGRILDALEQQLKVRFSPSPLPEKISYREVSVQYQNASVEELLQKLGNAANVEFERTDSGYLLHDKGEK